MRTFIAISTLLLAALLGGCFSIPSQDKPKVIVPDKKTGQYTYESLEADVRAYNNCFDAAGQLTNATLARQLRDRMIFGIRSEIDAWYLQLEEDMFEQRASFNTWADFLELGMAGAIGIVHGKADKTVLAAILSTGKGTRLSYDKNWFREKTTEVLITAMRAERTKALTAINGKMQNSTVTQYSFAEARADLIGYFQAGTLQGALIALSTDTGQKAAVAKNALDAQTKKRIDLLEPASDAAIKSVTALTKELKDMKEDRARKILKALTVEVAANAKLDDLIAKLREQIDQLQPDDAAGLKKLSDAFSQNK